MLEVLQRKAGPTARPPAAASTTATQGLLAGWREGLAIVNLRGNAGDAAFSQAAASALGVALPVKPCSTSEGNVVRIVWAGPD
ncbi:MAG TPA: hypothetical protein VFG86_04945, partial [Chloroflexota bacterium]|nr:hypothetical protein [Chloroflexota bacterium]